MADKLWTGGPWEQEDPQWPVPPKVTVPPPGLLTAAPRPRRRRKKLWKGGAVLVAVVAVITGLTLSLNRLFNDYFPGDSPPGDDYSFYYGDDEEPSDTPPAIPQAPARGDVSLLLEGAGEQELDLRQIYQKLSPSMVSIQAEEKDAYYYTTGTGIILTEDGYILTNAHIVAGADKVSVTFSDNNTRSARLAGFAAEEDLAVLKVEASGLVPADFGDSDLLEVGEPVAALGDPLGYRATMTDGIISALDRDMDVDGHTLSLIQTSAAINSGNSGGALINRYGQVVGVTTVKIVSWDGSSEALGFAIPSRRLKYAADRLIAGEQVSQGRFGITVDTRPLAGGGVAVLAVDENSDAAAQGIAPGDVILRADGTDVAGAFSLSRVRTRWGAGDPVELTVLRGGQELTVTVKLMEA